MADTIYGSKLESIERSIEEIKIALNRLTVNPNPPTAKSDLLNVEQCAQLTGLSVSTIYKHCHHRRLPFFKAGKFIVFKRQEVIDWMTSNRIKTAAEIEEEANNYLTTQS